MKRKCLLAVVAFLVLALVLPLKATAAVVGRFVMVQGQVDVLKQGKTPGIPVKLQDGVEPGDVIRTKAKAKAQVQFVDDSLMTLAPESRLAVADYVFDPGSQVRRATLRFFKGLMHLVVTRHLQLQEPDFIVETVTAVTGVRGTEWYTLLKPNSTLIYLIQGLLGVNSSIPQIPALLILEPMQFTEVIRDQQPRLGRPITPADLTMLKKLMDTGVPDSALFQPPGGLTALPPLDLMRRPEDVIIYVPPTVPAPSHQPSGGR
jgi:hypothetical protein